MKQTTAKRLKRVTDRMPAPNLWPAWFHFLMMVLIFAAGMTAGILWQAAPWAVLAFTGIMALALYGLWSK
jgi:uncharacterized membrane protein